MKTWKVAGYSYQTGYFIFLGTIQANTRLGALRLARKLYDTDKGINGYAEFIVTETN